VKNTITYYDTELITAVKSFKVRAPGEQISLPKFFPNEEVLNLGNGNGYV